MLNYMTIFSHMGIDTNILKKQCITILDSGEECEYSIKYSDLLVVNMPFIGNQNNSKKLIKMVG